MNDRIGLPLVRLLVILALTLAVLGTGAFIASSQSTATATGISSDGNCQEESTNTTSESDESGDDECDELCQTGESASITSETGESGDDECDEPCQTGESANTTSGDDECDEEQCAGGESANTTSGDDECDEEQCAGGESANTTSESDECDVNCDNHIDGHDVTMVLFTAGGLSTASDCPANGDVDGNQRVDSFDAVLILRYWAGLIKS